MVQAAKIGNFDLADKLFFKSMDNGINMLKGENKLLFIQNTTTDPSNPRYDMNNAMIAAAPEIARNAWRPGLDVL